LSDGFVLAVELFDLYGPFFAAVLEMIILKVIV
jgi:hypothetical protein